MKRILQVVGSLNVGGVEKMVCEWCKELSNEQYHIDFITYDQDCAFYEPEMIKLGMQVFHLPLPRANMLQFMKKLRRILKMGQYDVVHCHTLYNSGYYLQYAQKYHVPVRIAHSHTTQSREKIHFIYQIYQKYMKQKILKYATQYVACSPDAGEYLFGKTVFDDKGIVIPNGIQAEKYTYNPALRESIRYKYNMKDSDIVLGMVGRFHSVKNISFTLDLFENLKNQEGKYKLILVGDGPDRNEIEHVIKNKKWQDDVIITGYQNDPAPFYQAIDIYLMPSLFEGFGLSAIEAQAAGCKCLLSDQVPSFVKVAPSLEHLPLSERSKWIEAILCFKNSFVDRNNYVIRSEFDLKNSVKRVREIYDSNVNQMGE